MVAVSGAVIYPLLRYVELKRTDSVVYALLFAVAIGFIAYPLSIRVNIWTASQPEVSSAYQLGGDYIWHPKDDKTLPALPIYLKSSRW